MSDYDLEIRIDANMRFREAPKDVHEEAIRSHANRRLQAMAARFEKPMKELIAAAWIPDSDNA